MKQNLNLPLRLESARKDFNSGCNCAQAVLVNFRDVLKRSEQDLMAVASGFGGGMGKLQLTCGAVTGAFMAISLYASMQAEDNAGTKALAAGLIREFEGKFRAVKGTLSCREILGVDMNTEEGRQEAAAKDLYGTVCVSAVETAVRILGGMIGDGKNVGKASQKG